MATLKAMTPARAVSRRHFVARGAAVGALAKLALDDLGDVQAAGQPSSGVSSTQSNSPDQVIRRMIVGYRQTQLVYLAAKLRIADHLASGPQSVAALAAATTTNPDALYRVLRALASLGVFREEADRRFSLTPAAEVLRSGIPGSLRAAAEVTGEDWVWRAWGALRESVRTGRTGFDIVFGQNTFDWFASDPAAARLFDEFQADVTRRQTAAVVDAYSWPAVRRVTDIGGGNGTLLSALFERHAGLRGILFDLPHVVEVAKSVLSAHRGRCEFVGGDFFKSIPPGADAYVLKYILHDWDDGRARDILATVRRTMSPEAKLLVIEDLVCGPNLPCEAKIGDINMLARTGGRNRTQAEYTALLEASHFTVTRVLPASGDLAIIEAVTSQPPHPDNEPTV